MTIETLVETETFAETETREKPFDEELFFARLGLGLLGLGLRESKCGLRAVTCAAESTGTQRRCAGREHRRAVADAVARRLGCGDGTASSRARR
jgi:hypothetical protein